MPFELDYTELEFVRRALSIPAINAMGDVITRNAAHNAQPKALETVQWYPAERANQRYIRTDTYKNSAYADVNEIPGGSQIEFGSHGAIQDGRRYDQFLKDERQQAQVHKGRWRTLTEDADTLLPFVLDALETELAREGFV